MKGNFESLQSIVAEIEKQEEIKHDFLVPSRELKMVDDDFINFNSVKTDDVIKNTFHANPNFHNQLSTKLGIPKKYYDSMMEIPGLRSKNVNAWLEKRDDKNLVRTLDNSARAFLSDRYKPIDHLLILHSFLPSVQGMQIQFKSNSLTSSKMYLQMIFPRIEGEVEKGDVVQAGITLTNSETGQGSVDVSTFLYRLVCSNGMVGESLLHKYHAGRKVGDDIEDYNIYADDTIKAELKSFELRFRDILKHAISEVGFQDQLTKLRKAAGVTVEKPKEAVEEVTRRYLLNNEESDKLMNNFFGEKKTVWGLANSLTALAKTIENPDRQYYFECIGNDIVLKPDQWKEVA